MVKEYLRRKTAVNASEPPKFTAMEKVTIALSIGIMLGSLKFGGVFISTGMMVGFGMVFGAALVISKFEIIHLIITAYGKYLDFSVLILSFVLAVSPLGLIVSTFGGIFLSAYLGINRYWNHRQLYKQLHK